MNRNDSALIVVDTQRGVVGNGAEAERVVGNIMAAVTKARKAGVTVAWVRHEDENLVRGSDAWSLAEGLVTEEGDSFVAKRFNSSFEETGLDETLRERGIHTVILAGAATNWCVRATAYGALDRGYNLVLLSDAHTTGDLEIPGGPTIASATLIAELNVTIDKLEYPGRTGRSLSSAELAFD